jgi:hypothetical protein
MVERWLHIVSLEGMANQEVFKRVNSPREGKAWASVFPETSKGHYYYLERDLFKHMVSYIDLANGWYTNHMNEKQEQRYREMTNFNPNLTGKTRFVPLKF